MDATREIQLSAGTIQYQVYYTYFRTSPKPARSYFGATGFRRAGQLLQIDCIAYVD